MAATKYHYNPSTDRSGVCRANKKECPLVKDLGEELGSQVQHEFFDNKQEATEWARKIREDKYSTMYGNAASMSKNTTKKPKMLALDGGNLKNIANIDMKDPKKAKKAFLTYLEEVNDTGTSASVNHTFDGAVFNGFEVQAMGVEETTVKGQSFRDTKWSSVEVEEVVFQNCDFTGANMQDVKFSKCVFEKCTFDGSRMRHVNFDSAIIEESSFGRTTILFGGFDDATVVNNDMREVVFTPPTNSIYADMRHTFNNTQFDENALGRGKVTFDFNGGSFRGNDLSHMNVVNSSFHNVERVDMEGACVDYTSISDSEVYANRASFIGNEFTRVKFCESEGMENKYSTFSACEVVDGSGSAGVSEQELW